jgi:hypothetical protein
MIYVLVVSILALDGLYEGIKDRAPIWYAILNFIAIAVMVFMFCAYWIPSSVQSIRPLLPVLFLFSFVWEVCTARRGIQRAVRDISSELRPLVRQWMMGLEVITVFIGYWFAGAAVLRAI